MDWMNELWVAFGDPEAKSRLWTMLDQGSILLGYFPLLVASLAYLFRNRLRAWWHRPAFPAVGQPIREVRGRWDALVFTVSRVEVPKWVMESVRPRTVVLIGTTRSEEAVRELERAADRLGIRVVATPLLLAPDDPADARRRTAEAIGTLRAEGSERIAVDLTGGKTTMSLGAFIAAEEAGVASIYVTAEYDAEGQPIEKSARILCIARPESGI